MREIRKEKREEDTGGAGINSIIKSRQVENLKICSISEH